MHGDAAKCMTRLVQELRAELQQHAFTRQAQITFDVSWAPRGVDGRYYQWRELADATDFLFVMSVRTALPCSYYIPLLDMLEGSVATFVACYRVLSRTTKHSRTLTCATQYDMRSQIYYQCIAAANSPLALVKQGLEEFVFGFGIDPSKLVLGVPWYGYKYTCEPRAASDDAVCALTPVRLVVVHERLFSAMCRDACTLACLLVCVYGRVCYHSTDRTSVLPMYTRARSLAHHAATQRDSKWTMGTSQRSWRASSSACSGTR